MLTNKLQLTGIIQGPTGETGKSAYQHAVDNGFVGTEQEWIASLKGEIGKSSYEYAVDKGYQGSEEEFSQIIKDTLDAKDVVKTSREEVLAAKEATLTAKQSVDTSKTEVLSAKEAVDAAKSHVDQLNTQFETASKETIAQIKSDGTKAVSDITAAKDSALTGIQQEGTTQTSTVTNAGNTAVGNITATRDESVSKIQQEGTTQTSKVNETGNTAVGNVNTSKDQALTQIQNKGSEMLNAIGTGAVEEIAGSDIAADGTVKGSAILKELKGGTKQEKTNGYQLFDASKIPSKTENGLTLTNNMDGTFTFNGTITNGGLYSGFSYTHEETLKLLKTGKIYIKDLVKNLIRVSLIVDEKEKYNIRDSSSGVNYTTIVQEDLDNPTSYLKIMFFKNEYEGTYNDVLLKPMLYQDGDGTWEPFTGGVPSPNPDYQQDIKSIGGNGWFDGEFDQGWINGSTGVDDDSVDVIHGYTKIPCKASDLVHLHYDETVDYLGIALYKNDGTHLKNMSSGRKESRIDFVIPSGASYFAPQIQIDTGITVKNAKNLVVTVNGKYAVKAKTNTMNLIDLDTIELKNATIIDKNTNAVKSNIVNHYYSYAFITNEHFLRFISNNVGNRINFKCDLLNGTCEIVGIVIYGDRTNGSKFYEISGKSKASAIIPNDFINVKQVEFRWNKNTSPFTDTTSVYTNLMAWIGDDEPQTFVPYKELISYIPLDQPLYEGDRIYLEDGELWEYRENARIVFDGSEDEVWIVQQYNNLCAYIGNIDMNILDNAETRKVMKCNKFKTHPNNITGNVHQENGIAIEGMNVSHSGFFFGIYGLATDVPTWRTWLQQNPVEVVYKLKTPTLKKLGSAEAFNLRTFDERTYIEVSNSKELGTENTFIVPKNQLGGLATDAFAETKKQSDEFNQLYDKLYPMSEEFFTFGFIEHMNVLSPSNRIEYVCSNKNYSPMSINLTSHETNYGSWAKFPTLVENKPYMVKPTGEADYALNPDDYTKKLDGSSSDVANQDYNGGAFSKFIKIYVKRWVDGNDRHVRFSYYPLRGYEPCGFIDTDGREMDYVWLPMFYGSTVSGKMRSLSGLQPDINQNTDTQNTNIKAFSDRAAFFAGPIIETIKDMLYMLFKNTDLQAACGNGNSSGYNSASSPYYGVLPNAVVNGGQFYGSSDGKSLNKIFHSIVLGSYQQYQRDPYYLCVNGRYKVSIDYTYDVTGAKYVDTGIDSETVDANKWLYPSKCKVVDKFGNIPVGPWSGSTSTGYCDGIYHPKDKNFTAVVLRFGYCDSGSYAGLACSYLNSSAADATWSISASVLLKAPATA